MSLLRGPSIALRRLLLGGSLALTFALALPAASSAATSCEYNGAAETLTVKMPIDNNSAQLTVVGSEIVVRETGLPLACGGPATLAKTENIVILDESGNGSTRVAIINPAKLAPTTKILYFAGAGSGDEIYLQGAQPTANHFVLGAKGIDIDSDGVIDLSFILGTVPDFVDAEGGETGDTMTGQGSAATGAPVGATLLELKGNAGGDLLEGGESTDLIDGGSGNDILLGAGGTDVLDGDGFAAPGDDTIDGGAGVDRLEFAFNLITPVTVDLAKTTPQPIGAQEGTDSISGVENVTGTDLADTLSGDAGPNVLFGRSGNDTIDGRGGADTLNGESGTDTVTYADAPAGVSVNLLTGTVSGGAGADTLAQFENLTGSPFNDQLTGSDAANTIDALGGTDTVQALAGPDLVAVRDGVADNASCGAGIDRAVSDRRSLDAIQPDCEQVDALPEPTGPGSKGGTGPGNLAFRLAGAHNQRLLKRKAIVVKVRCPRQDCTVTLRGGGGKVKLAKKTVRLKAGIAKTLRLPLGAAQLEAIRAQLGEGLKSKLTVRARAVAAGANPASGKLIVTAKR